MYSVEIPKFQASDDNDDYTSVPDNSFAHSQPFRGASDYQPTAQEESFIAD